MFHSVSRASDTLNKCFGVFQMNLNDFETSVCGETVNVSGVSLQLIVPSCHSVICLSDWHTHTLGMMCVLVYSFYFGYFIQFVCFFRE